MTHTPVPESLFCFNTKNRSFSTSENTRLVFFFLLKLIVFHFLWNAADRCCCFSLNWNMSLLLVWTWRMVSTFFAFFLAQNQAFPWMTFKILYYLSAHRATLHPVQQFQKCPITSTNFIHTCLIKTRYKAGQNCFQNRCLIIFIYTCVCMYI